MPLDRPRHAPAAHWGKPGSVQYRKTNNEYQRRYNKTPRCRARLKLWMDKNRDKLRSQDLARREQAKAHIIETKRHPCEDCDRRYGPHVMDFDHVRGRKIANISSGRFHGSMKALKREITKCDVVCANCHREREHKRRMKNPTKWMRGWKKGTTR